MKINNSVWPLSLFSKQQEIEKEEQKNAWPDAFNEAQISEERRSVNQAHQYLVRCLESSEKPNSRCFDSVLAILDDIGWETIQDSLSSKNRKTEGRPQFHVGTFHSNQELAWIVTHPLAQEAFIQREEKKFVRCLQDRLHPEEVQDCHRILSERLKALINVQKIASGKNEDSLINTSNRLQNLIRRKFPFFDPREFS